MGLGSFDLTFLYMAPLRFCRSYSYYSIGNVIPVTNALVTVAQWQFTEIHIQISRETFVLAIFFSSAGVCKGLKGLDLF